MIFGDAEFSKFVWVASAFFTFSIVLLVFECVCGCRKRIPKDDLSGLAGMVKITNPDENVNFNTTVPEVQLNSVTITSDELIGDNHDTNKRNSTMVSTATRSLPDLPVDSGEGEKVWGGPQETNTDTNSELYATVEDSNRGKKRILTRGQTVDSSYTPSQTDDSLSPYARLKGEHPYDQLHKSEHQYAQVGANGGPVASTSQDTTVNSTPSRRFEAERESRSKTPESESEEIIDDIPAASAIAGSVPANHDLPYMTPPIPNQHFSGDSQDSSKGYTSISVREPLARIMAVSSTRRVGSGAVISDPHYATVSDDSDEMYAAIEERGGGGGGEYTSGSETYAQIAHQPPPPPTAPSSNTSTHHSRQESSSSACSSVVNTGSPKREKRQANSPLPEPPQSPALDEMYAKVVKKQRSTNSGVGTPEAEEPSTSIGSGSAAASVGGGSVAGPAADTNGCQGEDEGISEPNYEELEPAAEPDYASLSRPHDPDYERLRHRPDYERIKRQPSLLDEEGPGYERVGTSVDPNYETVRNDCGGGCSSSGEEVPNYESVGEATKKKEEEEEEGEPPYEKVRHQVDLDYETVLSHKGDLYHSNS